ncbi:hypothetical protein EVAR_36890_1 [Eumeta japonica]|uniref:Uncharacterized protein n=1 Tax=Eumeta variegata TaxID=151549 RepID=A0A4C1WV64_EUMVA|nr:hypothetical protein EVAR_36890_1 [Eumeta japonica]
MCISNSPLAFVAYDALDRHSLPHRRRRENCAKLFPAQVAVRDLTTTFDLVTRLALCSNADAYPPPDVSDSFLVSGINVLAKNYCGFRSYRRAAPAEHPNFGLEPKPHKISILLIYLENGDPSPEAKGSINVCKIQGLLFLSAR